MMTYDQIDTATRDELSDEMAAAGIPTEGWETMLLDDMRAVVRDAMTARDYAWPWSARR